MFSLSKAAKRVHGFTCQCCGFNFEQAYGVLGREYIEAHHLVPLSALDGHEPVSRYDVPFLDSFPYLAPPQE